MLNNKLKKFFLFLNTTILEEKAPLE